MSGSLPRHEQHAWRARLYARLRGRPYPLWVFDDDNGPTSAALSAAALWTGARVWTDTFRRASVRPGDRIVLALPASPAWLFVLVAALWDDLTLVPVRSEQEIDLDGLMARFDARAGVAPAGTVGATWTPDAAGLPARAAGPRTPLGPPTPLVRFLLNTSGATGRPRAVALSDANVQAVLDSHAPRLALHERETRLLSVLPWHHAFGLVIELLPALLAGAEIVRDASGDNGRDPVRLLDLLERHESTHLNAVPLTIKCIAQTGARGEAALQRLHDGVIGGAPVRGDLAAFLSGTRLRAGYGQTEASPGIALGAPGAWPGAGYLGRPLGCETRVNEGTGLLHFRGPNACAGFWHEERGITYLPPGRWADTGDLVRAAGDGCGDLFFVGREGDTFKLSNGRQVVAGVWEAALKAGQPQIGEALLFSPDSERLELCVAVLPFAAAPTLAAARACLGPLGARLYSLHVLPEAGWVRRAKGDVDRAATRARLLRPAATADARPACVTSNESALSGR